MHRGVVRLLFALVLMEFSASIRGQNRSDKNLAVEEDGVSSALSTAATTIFSASSASSSVITESVIHREQAIPQQIVQSNVKDGDGDTSYQNATVSSEMENRREVSKPLSRDEIIQQGFANVTQKLEEIRWILSPFSIISGTLLLGHQIIRFTKYVYHKLHDSRPADDE